jgi:hypothetical protein
MQGYIKGSVGTSIMVHYNGKYMPPGKAVVRAVRVPSYRSIIMAKYSPLGKAIVRAV